MTATNPRNARLYAPLIDGAQSGLYTLPESLTAAHRAVTTLGKALTEMAPDDVLRELALVPGPAGVPDCNERLRATTGLTYPQMLKVAAQAGFRHALRQIGDSVADMMEATTKRSSRLAGLTGELGPAWDAWIQRS